MKALISIFAVVSMHAASGGALVSPDQLGPSRGTLAAEISKAHQVDPAAFRQVAALQQREPSDLKDGVSKLGPRALWPVVELVAFDAPRPAKNSAALLEALEELHERQSAPVFEAVLRSEGQPLAVYAVATRALADTIEAHPDAAHAKSVIDGLAASKCTHASVRDAAAKALITAYMGYEGDVRQAASEALVTVDAPDTELLIENEKILGVGVPELTRLQQELKSR
jgi:hypothetical protein